MFIYIESLFLIIIEVFCCKIFFEIFAEKKFRNKLYYYMAFVIQLSYTYLISLFIDNNFLLKELLIISGITIIMVLILRINIIKALCLAALFQGILLLIDYFVLWLNLEIFGSIMQVDESYYIQGNLLVIMGKVFLFIIILIIDKYIGKKSKERLAVKEWLQFMIFPVFTIISIVSMLMSAGNIKNEQQGDILLSIAIGIVFMNIIVFYLINNILDREMQIRKSALLKLEAANKLAMYYSISENLNSQMKKTHEYKNQIMCIQGLLNEKRYPELNGYIQKINDNFITKADMIDTNNSVINAVLNTKYNEMLKNNIVFIFKINDLSHIKIDDEDIVIILSNLLNNAIEACQKYEKEKYIKLKFVKEEDNIIISVKNTYNGILIKDNENIITSKTEKLGHGIGISNIIDIIKKYNGKYVIKAGDEEFYFSIMI